jgi:hypothetical protein
MQTGEKEIAKKGRERETGAKEEKRNECGKN